MGKSEIIALWRKILFTVCKLLKIKGYGISILVPLYLDQPNGIRAKNWRWLEKYWKANLPGAEIIIGSDEEAIRDQIPFSKSVAVNNAASKANGDVYLVIDADGYMPVELVVQCAREIRLAQAKGRKLWFIPYRRFYRLTQDASEKIIASNSRHKTQAASPPAEEDFENKLQFHGTPVSRIAHWYGAMAQMMPREAFNTMGGWDPRFRGWGGEDHAAMVAMDTLYGPHKTSPGQILHLWHPILVPEDTDYSRDKRRMWANQNRPGSNDALSGRYYWSNGDPKKMRRLVDEFKDKKIASKTSQRQPYHVNVSS